MIESTAITRELGARLRECRELARLKTADVARKLDWPASKVSRLESGDRRCDPMDLAMFLGACNVPQDKAWTIIKLAKEPDCGIWARPHGKQPTDLLLTLVMNETAATSLYEFHPNLIPGLLQTKAYATAVIQGMIMVGPGDVEARLKARIQRQELLKGRDSAEATFFITESTLRYPALSPADMNEQLLHLVFMTAHPRVRIRVVPMSAGLHAGMRGPFIFMGFHDRRPVVFLESEVVSTLVEDREMIEVYRMIRSELHRIALDEEESRYLLTDLASEFDREAEERNRGGGLA